MILVYLGNHRYYSNKMDVLIVLDFFFVVEKNGVTVGETIYSVCLTVHFNKSFVSLFNSVEFFVAYIFLVNKYYK